MAILDISKVVMYEYYYDFLKEKYGDNVCMLYTDTDSFIIEAETEDFYGDMMTDLQRYDTSDYPENNIYGIPRAHAKVPGLFKDELKGQIITEFVGLRSKMYSVRTGVIDKMKKAKGVKNCVLKREIGFSDYVHCLRNTSTIVKEQKSFRTKLHKMFTIQQDKIALSPYDDKRHILSCMRNECKGGSCDTCCYGTYAHGHYNIERRRQLSGGEGTSFD